MFLKVRLVYALLCRLTYVCIVLRGLEAEDVKIFRRLSRIYLTLEAIWLDEDDDPDWEWEQLFGFFETKPLLLPNLQKVDFNVGSISFYKFKALARHEHPAWNAMKRFLGPDRTPKLKGIGVELTWMYKSPVDVSDEGDQLERVNSQLRKVFFRCLPSWEDDEREVEMTLDLEPEYE